MSILQLIRLIPYNTVEYTTRPGFHSRDLSRKIEGPLLELPIHCLRSKGLCSSYLFTVYNTDVYMYLSDRKVSFVNSEIFCMKGSYRKKKLLIHKCSKQLVYSKCLLVPELVQTMSTTCLSLKLCK